MTADGFSVQVRDDDGVAVLDLHGEVNAFAQAELEAAYEEAVSRNPTTVLLNFEDVTYINSTGIALIVGLLAKARAAHRRVSACGLTDHYQEIFSITRLSDFMSIYPDEETAVAGPAGAARER